MIDYLNHYSAYDVHHSTYDISIGYDREILKQELVNIQLSLPNTTFNKLCLNRSQKIMI